MMYLIQNVFSQVPVLLILLKPLTSVFLVLTHAILVLLMKPIVPHALVINFIKILLAKILAPLDFIQKIINAGNVTQLAQNVLDHFPHNALTVMMDFSCKTQTNVYPLVPLTKLEIIPHIPVFLVTLNVYLVLKSLQTVLLVLAITFW
jgi:hypothetical protein